MWRKWRKQWLAVLLFLLLLSGCGTDLQKPTGLEGDTADPVAEKMGQPLDDETSENESKDDETPQVKEGDKSAEQAPAKEQDVVEKQPKDTQSQPQIKKEATEVTKKTEISQPEAQRKTQPKAQPKAQPKEQQPPNSKNVAPAQKEKKQPVTGASSPAKDKTPPPTSENSDKQATIVYSIVISDTEVPLPPTEMTIKEGDTVLAALIAITRKHKIQMDYRGGQGATAYVEGIDNVYEFDRGQGSGWMYRVNGIFPDRGAGVVPLQDGDRVEWLYTTNLGVDLNADLKPFRR